MENPSSNSTTIPTPKHPKFVRWALLIGIVIVLNIFFFVVVQIVIPTPKYSEYCPQPVTQAHTAATCDAQNGVWTKIPPLPSTSNTGIIKENTGYCNYYTKCQVQYDAASSRAHLYSFVLLMVLGIISLVIGVVPIGASIVSSGLSYGGVLALIIGSTQYWGSAEVWLRLVISGIALGVLIYLGMRRFKDER